MFEATSLTWGIPLLRDQPFASKDGRVYLTSLCLAASGLRDSRRARRLCREPRLSLDFAEKLPLTVGAPSKHDEARKTLLSADWQGNAPMFC
jgi:hypothetical protein